MKVLEFDSTEAWMNARLGCASGSEVRDMVTTKGEGTKSGVYRKVAESIVGSITLAEDNLLSGQVLKRGHDLEPDAIAAFEKRTGRKVSSFSSTKKLVIWQSDEDARMIVSPDGSIGKTEAVEVKSFLSAKHVEAICTGDFPKNTGGYEEQRLQHFIVNKSLKKHHTAFFHPDFPPPLNLFIVTKTRKELAAEIASFERDEKKAIAKVREMINKLTMYSPAEIAAVQKVEKELLAGAEVAHQEDMQTVQATIRRTRKLRTV